MEHMKLPSGIEEISIELNSIHPSAIMPKDDKCMTSLYMSRMSSVVRERKNNQPETAIILGLINIKRKVLKMKTCWMKLINIYI